MAEYGGAEFSIGNNGSINKVPNSNSQPENQMERTGLTDAFAAGLVFPQETSIFCKPSLVQNLDRNELSDYLSIRKPKVLY